MIFFVKQKTAYEMRSSDWSSDVCSSDLRAAKHQAALAKYHPPGRQGRQVNTNIRSLKGENRTLDKGNTIRQRHKLLFQPGFLPSDPLQCFVKACSGRQTKPNFTLGRIDRQAERTGAGVPPNPQRKIGRAHV